MRRLLSLRRLTVILVVVGPLGVDRRDAGPTTASAAPPSSELPQPRPAGNVPAPPPLSPSILEETARPIDLASALQLAGVQNPEVLRARERVTEADALRQLAATQLLPTLNVGTNVDAHQGVLQQSN